MRKIISKYEEDKKKKRNQFIVGGILMLVMLVSVLGYAFQGQAINPTGSSNLNTTTYNGVTFTNQNGFWITTYNNQNLAFTYNPSSISSNLINLTRTISDFTGKPLYIYSDDNNAESEIGANLANFAKGIYPIRSILGEDCANNEIIIQNNSISSVSQEQNCIKITGEGQDLIATTDNVMFKLFGIKQ
jgi:hypothetical protein